MNEAQRREKVLSDVESAKTIVNEEFAKNATPDVTKAAILSRLDSNPR